MKRDFGMSKNIENWQENGRIFEVFFFREFFGDG
jgi:hypothetical protein